MSDKTPTPRTDHALEHERITGETEVVRVLCVTLERDLAAAREALSAKDAEIAQRYNELVCERGQVALWQIQGRAQHLRAERAESRLRTVEAERDALTDVLHRSGFRRCDIPACNCGSWHHRYGWPERFKEIDEDTVDEWRNGETLRDRVKRILAERDALRDKWRTCKTIDGRLECAVLRDDLVALQALEMNHEGACVRLTEENAALRADLREMARRDARVKAAEALSNIYFDIAEAVVGTEEVRRQREERLARRHATNAADAPEAKP